MAIVLVLTGCFPSKACPCGTRTINLSIKIQVLLTEAFLLLRDPIVLDVKLPKNDVRIAQERKRRRGCVISQSFLPFLHSLDLSARTFAESRTF